MTFPSGGVQTMGKNDELALQNNFENWSKNRFPNAPKDLNVWEYYCVEQFARPFDLGDGELKSGMIGGGGDGGVDAFYILANGELVDTETEIKPKQKPEFKLVIMQVKSNEGFSPEAVDKLFWFIDDLLDLNKSKADYHSTYNDDLTSLMRLFKDKFGIVIGETPPLSIEFTYIIKKDVPPNSDCLKAKSRVIDRCKYHFSQAEPKFSFANATALWTQVQTRSPNKKILQWASQPMSTAEGEIGLVTLPDYYSFISDADGRVAERFFDSNVRGYWPHSRVNKDIAKTLCGTSGPEFWLLNNGITILAEKSNTTSGFLELEIYDPQIVNGLQTSRQIYSYFAGNGGEKADARRLMVRVIKSSDKPTRDAIIKCTNSQNEMPAEALRTTDAIHRQLEGAFHTKGLYYDRRKGYYREKGKPVESIISVIDVAQAMIAVVLQRPDDARARPKGYLVNDEKYDSLFGKKSSGEDRYSLTVYIKAVELVRWVGQFLDKVEDETIHRRNLLFYVAMYAACEICSCVRPSSSLIESIDLSSLESDWLEKPWGRVSKKYQSLADKRINKEGEKDFDKVAKGPDLLKAIESDLRTRFGKKQQK
jgi:AIPR protein